MQDVHVENERAIAAATALAAMAFACAVAWRHDLSLVTLEFGVAVVALAAATLSDCKSRTIPNSCVAALLAARGTLLAIGLGTEFATPDDIASSVAGAAVIGGGLAAVALAADRLMHTESIGGGDIKLFAAAGAYFGIEGGIVVVLAACLVGLLTSRLFGEGDGTFAFGPAIAFAFCLVMACS